MLAGRFFVVFALFMSLAGIGCELKAAKEVKESENLRKEYNDKGRQSDAVNIDLIGHGILLTSGTITRESWDLKTPAQKAEIKMKLNTILSLVTRMLEIEQHKNVDTQLNRDLIVTRKAGAQRNLAAIATYENGGTKPVDPANEPAKETPKGTQKPIQSPKDDRIKFK